MENLTPQTNIPPAPNKRFPKELAIGSVVLLAVAGIVAGYYVQTRPVPTPTSAPRVTQTDATANWQTYANELGYSFKYPSDWIVEENAVFPKDKEPYITYLRVEIQSESFEKVRERLKRNIGGRNSVESEIVISGEAGYSYLEKFPVTNEQGQTLGHLYEILVQYGDKVYYIWTQKYNLDEVKQILSTFKFGTFFTGYYGKFMRPDWGPGEVECDGFVITKGSEPLLSQLKADAKFNGVNYIHELNGRLITNLDLPELSIEDKNKILAATYENPVTIEMEIKPTLDIGVPSCFAMYEILDVK